MHKICYYIHFNIVNMQIICIEYAHICSKYAYYMKKYAENMQ